jgi:hypothetical protein
MRERRMTRTVKRIYFDAWPDGVGRQAWPGITYVRIRPT